MKKLLLTALVATAALTSWAQKQLYIPQEWRNRTDTLIYSESDPDNKYTWSKTRSKESDNFIVYWQKGYGSKLPTNAAETYRVDIDDLLKKAEQFYELNVTKLGFGAAGSKMDKYKSMILLNYTTEWMAYGGGYDFTVPALWISPSTCKPVGHTIAHEIGHSFQYMGYSDLGGGAGFHFPQGQGSGFWEQTAQWQAAQAYPDQKWNESWLVYGVPYFPRACNYAMTHEWMRYQSYWWHYYLVEKYNDREIIGKIWRHDPGLPSNTSTGYNATALDANEVLMHLKGIDAKELYRMYFEYAMKMATVDIDVDGCKEEGLQWTEFTPYVYNYVPLGGTKHQVAYASCPQSTGFNIITLDVPAAGTVVETEFTSPRSSLACADGDPMQYLNGDNQYVSKSGTRYNTTANYNALRGFRLGYVALLSNNERVYLYDDSVYCADDTKSSAKTVTVKATVPAGTKRLYFVVSPAPRQYVRHLWNEKMEDDDQWPYQVEFKNTNIKGAPTDDELPEIDASYPITDATITYDVNLPVSSGYYSMQLYLANKALGTLGTALQMQSTKLAAVMEKWSATNPTDGKAKFYAINPRTGKVQNAGSNTNAVYGHWFKADGNRVDHGATAAIWSDFYPENLNFVIGQYPNALKVGQTYTYAQAIRYKRGDELATVKFVFNVTATAAGTEPSYTLASAEGTLHDVLTAISAPQTAATATPAPAARYNLAGQRVGSDYKGLVIENGKKILVK